MDLKNFSQAIRELSEEKGIAVEKVIETIELAIAAAYKKDYGKKGQIVRAKFNPDTGKVTFIQIKIAVDESMIKTEEEIATEEEERQKRIQEALERGERVRRIDEDEDDFIRPRTAGGDTETEEPKKVRFNTEKHLMLDEAKKEKKGVKPGDELEFPLEAHEDFGRIASQTAKQVIIQRIREAEREAVYEEYKGKEGELVSGIVQRIEGRNIYIDLGRGMGMLPYEEQIPRERYRIGERLKALVVLAEKNPKGPGIFLSRSHPRFLEKVFELEVPEIASGAVQIKSIAREAGMRSKVAVVSIDENIDPVGSMVGQKGVRVTTVINELGGEKIDIIEWDEKPEKFIAHALSPARVLDVEMLERAKTARALVPDDQLSLAIGKGGQNVRLAAKLTGWKIDVRSEKTEGVVAAPEDDVAETKAEDEATPLSEEKREELKATIEEALEEKAKETKEEAGETKDTEETKGAKDTKETKEPKEKKKKTTKKKEEKK
ncbi:MAG: transcription termination factor NusA [bacterium]|nr:transcription termination factor NusA [bacterium]